MRNLIVTQLVVFIIEQVHNELGNLYASNIVCMHQILYKFPRKCWVLLGNTSTLPWSLHVGWSECQWTTSFFSVILRLQRAMWNTKQNLIRAIYLSSTLKCIQHPLIFILVLHCQTTFLYHGAHLLEIISPYSKIVISGCRRHSFIFLARKIICSDSLFKGF